MNRVFCPHCGRRLKYAGENAGKKAKCQKCGQSFRLPTGTPGDNPPSSSRRKIAAAADAVGEAASPLHDPSLHDPDVQLMLHAKAGDDAAFGQLVANYQARLVAVMTPHLGSRDAAEDLAQETFMRIYRARQGYEPTARFATWLFRIANNLVKNRHRDASRRVEIELNVHDASLSGTLPVWGVLAEKSGEMPTRKADKSELCSMVQAALAALNDQQRMAVLLHDFERMSYNELAVALDLGPAAAKSLLVRAHNKLRGKLEPYVRKGTPVSIPSD
jgi:RNA polymerase sigma-70 factor (ECF subfamily)